MGITTKGSVQIRELGLLQGVGTRGVGREKMHPEGQVERTEVTKSTVTLPLGRGKRYWGPRGPAG